MKPFAGETRSDRQPLARGAVGLYALSLALGLLFGLLSKYRAAPGALEADEGEYFLMATRLLEGSPTWDARRTLGFPLVLATIRAIRDNFLFLQIATTAIYALSASLLFLLVRKLSGSARVGLAAGLMLAVWPTAIFYGTSLYSESLALPLFLAAMLALPLGTRAPLPPAPAGWRAAIGAGALLGVTAHVRPMYLLFLPFLAAILFAEERDWRRAAGRFGAALIGFGLVILPWSVAMSTHFGHPILLTANGGETLAGGLNPTLAEAGTTVDRVTGRSVWTGPGKWLPIGQTGYLSEAEQHLPYDQADAILQQRTRAWILSHPMDALRLELCKVGYMWGVYAMLDNGKAQMLAGNLPTIGLLLIAILSLLLWPAGRWRYARLWILPLFVTGIALISWGSWRFRQPGDAGLLGFVAVSMPCLLARFGARRAGTPVLSTEG